MERRKRFVFFGKGGEFESNRLADQEISALALQLVQASVVYVNTRMVRPRYGIPYGRPGWHPKTFAA